MSITAEDLEAGRVDLSDVVDPTIPRRPPVTPGEILREEFLVPLGLSANRLAIEMGIPANRITAILNGTRGITAGTAILLGRRFGNSAEFWLGLQMEHDLEVARAKMAA